MKDSNLYERLNKEITFVLKQIGEGRSISYKGDQLVMVDSEGREEVLPLEEIARSMPIDEEQTTIIRPGSVTRAEPGKYGKHRAIGGIVEEEIEKARAKGHNKGKRSKLKTALVAGAVTVFLTLAANVVGSYVYSKISKSVREKNWTTLDDRWIYPENVKKSEDVFLTADRPDNVDWPELQGDQDALLPEKTIHAMLVRYKSIAWGKELSFVLGDRNIKDLKFRSEKDPDHLGDPYLMRVSPAGTMQVAISDKFNNLEDINVEVSLGNLKETYVLREGKNIHRRNGEKAGIVEMPLSGLEDGINELVVKTYDRHGPIGILRLPVSMRDNGNNLYLSNFEVDSDIKLRKSKDGGPDKVFDTGLVDERKLSVEYDIEMFVKDLKELEQIKEVWGSNLPMCMKMEIPALKLTQMHRHYMLWPVLEDEDMKKVIEEETKIEKDKIIGYQYKTHGGVDLMLPVGTPEGIYDVVLSVSKDQKQWNKVVRQIGVYHDSKGVPILFDPYSEIDVERITLFDEGVKKLKKIEGMEGVSDTYVMSSMAEGYDHHFKFEIDGEEHTLHLSDVVNKKDESYRDRVDSAQIRIDNCDKPISIERYKPIHHKIGDTYYLIRLVDKVDRVKRFIGDPDIFDSDKVDQPTIIITSTGLNYHPLKGKPVEKKR